MEDLESMNSFILQQVIKKRTSSSEGVVEDRRKQKDHFLKLIQHIGSVSDGQASMAFDDENFHEFLVTITPKGGPYCNGKFLFQFKITETYPSTAPKIVCLTKIYHPNIDDEGDICLSIVNDWSNNKNDLIDCIQGLLFLFYHPNLDDPLSPYFAPGEDFENFLENVKLSIQGQEILEIGGVSFDKVVDT